MKSVKLFLLIACLILMGKTYGSQEVIPCDSSDFVCVELVIGSNNYNKKSLLRMRNTGIVPKIQKSGIFWTSLGIFLGLLVGIPLMIIAADVVVMGASFMISFGRGIFSPIMFLTGMSGGFIL